MNGPCVQKDDYENKLKGMIKETDMLVFVMPVYCYNWPAQPKMVIDRFYSYTTELTKMHKKAVLPPSRFRYRISVTELIRRIWLF